MREIVLFLFNTMTGRGRSFKAASGDEQKQTKEKKTSSLPKKEEAKKQKLKEGKPTEAMLHVPETKLNGATWKFFEEEAKTCATGTQTLVRSSKDDKPLKPETQRNERAAPQKTKKSQPCSQSEKGKAKIDQKKPDKDEANSILTETLNSLTIRMEDRSNAAEVINEITKRILTHLKKNTVSFKAVGKPLCTGSYYEKVKISYPDEFDVMIPIPVERVELNAFGDDGAFYHVALKRGETPLEKFKEGSTLCASPMLDEFRDEVKKCVKDFKEWEVTRKKKGCPAVTLNTTVNSVPISLDLVLCIMVKSRWPDFTSDGLKIEKWLGNKVRRDFRQQPYYLVPKFEGKGTEERDGVLAKDVWRISFSHVEKAMLMNHGSEKTCCEKGGASCCRKDCLKLLKHLLHLLKEKDTSLEKFCSYHAKTTLLHLCCSQNSDSNWKSSDLSDCFQRLLEEFQRHLKNGFLPNFFITSQNLLSAPGEKLCRKLAVRLREEHQNGFPTLKEHIRKRRVH